MSWTTQSHNHLVHEVALWDWGRGCLHKAALRSRGEDTKMVMTNKPSQPSQALKVTQSINPGTRLCACYTNYLWIQPTCLKAFGWYVNMANSVPVTRKIRHQKHYKSDVHSWLLLLHFCSQLTDQESSPTSESHSKKSMSSAKANQNSNVSGILKFT